MHTVFLCRTDAHDLDLFADLHDAALDPPRRNRATARDREHVLDRHQERLVHGTRRRRDVLVDRRDQLADRVLADLRVGPVHRVQRRALDDRNVVAGIVVGRQKLADFHLDELQKLLVIHLVDLVHVDDHVGNAHLAAQQDVLARLRHRAVGGRHHQDRAVHLRRTRDHVLHIVGVAGAVDMGIVPRFRLVFHMRRRDRDPARTLFRRAVDLVIGPEFAEILRDRRRQRRLAVVNVTNGPDVHMRFRPFKLCLGHGARLAVRGPRCGALFSPRGTYPLGGRKSSACTQACPTRQLCRRRSRRPGHGPDRVRRRRRGGRLPCHSGTVSTASRRGCGRGRRCRSRCRRPPAFGRA